MASSLVPSPCPLLESRTITLQLHLRTMTPMVSYNQCHQRSHFVHCGVVSTVDTQELSSISEVPDNTAGQEIATVSDQVGTVP